MKANQGAVVIRPLLPTDQPLFPDGVKLLNRSQGEDLFAPDYLANRASDPLSYVVGAVANNALVAIGVASLIDTFDYYKPFDEEIGLELAKKRVGSFSTLCVVESMRGRGIGQSLSQLRLDWLQEKKCEVILGVSWVSGLGHTSDRVFEKLGFHAVKKAELFYYKSSIEKPFFCPGCRAAPCICAAVLYRRNLKIL